MHTVCFGNHGESTNKIAIGCPVRAYEFAKFLEDRYDRVEVRENEYPGERDRATFNVIAKELSDYLSVYVYAYQLRDYA